MDPTLAPPPAWPQRLLRLLPLGLLVVSLAAFPLVVTKPYPLHMGVMLFLAVLLGSAWNILGGYAGQYSIGHAAYFGVGAYTAVLLWERLHVPPWWGLFAAMGAAVVVGLVIGTITFRLRGPYFVLGSIAVAEIIRLLVTSPQLHPFTNGAEGFVVSGPRALHVLGLDVSLAGKRPFYWLTLAVAVLAVIASRAILRSRLGYFLQAIREDQDAAASLGIRLSVSKNAALAASAALTGLAGAIFAGYTGFIDPGVFGLDASVSMVLFCILGGVGTVEGPVIGAALLVPLDEILRNPRGLVTVGILPSDSGLVAFIGRWLTPAHLLVHGLVLVLLILFAPEGVAGLIRRFRGRRRAEAPPAPSPAA